MSLPPHRFTLRATAEPTKPAKVHVRKLGFVAGDPVTFDSDHPHVTALEYLLGAVAADLIGGLRRIGRKRRVEVDALEVLITAELHDPLVYLRVVDHETGNAGLSRIHVKAYISSLADEPDVERVWQEALASCPVIHTLRPGVALELVYHQVT